MVLLRTILAQGRSPSTKAAYLARVKRRTQNIGTACAALVIGTATGLGMPAASGAPVDLTSSHAPLAESFDASEQPVHDIAGAPLAHAVRELDLSLGTVRRARPTRSVTTLRYGAPILASMCRAAPALCMPAEPSEAAREASAVAGDAAGTDSDATRFPLVGASPWAVPDTRYIACAGRIERSLHDTLTQADLPADVLIQIERVFAGQLDANASALPGDGYRIVYERADRRDAVLRRPRVSAVEIRFRERTYTAFWFIAPGSTRGDYYAFDGRLLAAEPFAMPVNYDRISSPFGVRLHPVSGEERFHTGVDLTAPRGAPVVAADAGTVAFAGTQSGYGKQVVISHAAGYVTYYAHLSAFAGGLHAGAPVARGERIGFVGRTGSTTGPHLHFEVRLNNQPTAPLALTEDAFAPPLTPEQWIAFERAADAAREQLAELPAAGTRVAASYAAVFF